MKVHQHLHLSHRWQAISALAGVTVLLLLSLIISLRSDVWLVSAQSGPTVGVVRDTLGQQAVTVAIAGTGLANLGGFEFDLGVDPAVAQVTTATVGSFLGTSGRTVGSLGPIIGSQRETVGFGAYSYDPSGNNGPGASGNGDLAFISMDVISDGVSSLTLNNPIFANVDATQQSVTTTNAALQAKTLHSGWNLIALCVDTTGLGVTETLQSATGGYDMVLGEHGTYVVGLPNMFQSLNEIVPPWSHYVRATEGVTLTQVAPPIDPSAPITLTTGWRWIGYCVTQSEPVTVALSSIAGKYDMVIGEHGTYVVGLPDMFQSLRALRQGNGYMVRMTANGTLIYPAGAPRVATLHEANVRAGTGKCAGVQNTPYLTMAYGHVLWHGQPAPVGSVVEAVTPRDEVAGCFEVTTAGAYGVMQLYGADDDGGIPGFRPGETIHWRVNGVDAKGAPDFTWGDDKAVHEVALSVASRSSSGVAPIFLPLVEK